jgi:hypothetical protein
VHRLRVPAPASRIGGLHRPLERERRIHRAKRSTARSACARRRRSRHHVRISATASRIIQAQVTRASRVAQRSKNERRTSSTT